MHNTSITARKRVAAKLPSIPVSVIVNVRVDNLIDPLTLSYETGIQRKSNYREQMVSRMSLNLGIDLATLSCHGTLDT